MYDMRKKISDVNIAINYWRSLNFYTADVFCVRGLGLHFIILRKSVE